MLLIIPLGYAVFKIFTFHDDTPYEEEMLQFGNLTIKKPRISIGGNFLDGEENVFVLWNESYWITIFPNFTYVNNAILNNISYHEANFKHGNTSQEIMNVANQSGLILNYSAMIIPDNQSWSENYAMLLFAPISLIPDNSSWNESKALELFYNRVQTVSIINTYIGSHEATFKHGNTSEEIFSVVNNGTFLDKAGGIITGNVLINGDLSVVGSRVELNVTDVLVNGSYNPQIDSLFDLGSPLLRWNHIYANLIEGLIDWSNVSNKPTQLSQFSNDVGYLTSSHETNFKHGNTSSEIFSVINNNSFYPYSLNPASYLTSTHETNFKHGNTSAEIMSVANASGLIKNWSSLIVSYNSSWNESYANTKYAKYQFGNNNFNGSGIISTTNKIGIGVSSPSHILELKGSDYDIRVLLDTPNLFSYPGLEFRHNGDENLRALIRSDYVSSGTQAILAFWVSGGGSVRQAMTINGIGNVGIGTTSPSTLLEVNGVGKFNNLTSNGGNGITKTVWVGNASNNGNCSLIFIGGLYTGGTC